MLVDGSNMQFTFILEEEDRIPSEAAFCANLLQTLQTY